MEFLQLEYFLCIAEKNSISKAAEELHVSQPSLSSALRRLETELGAQLFTRVGRGIVLNDYGRFVMQRVKQMFEISKSIKVHAGYRGEERHLSVGFENYNEWIFSLINQYQEIHPNVVVDMYGSTLAAPFPFISYDFIVSYRDFRLNELANSILIESRDYYVVLPKGHPLAAQESICLSQLSNERFCFLRTAKGDFEHAYDYCIQAGFRPKCVYATNNSFYKLRYMQKANCVTIIPSGWYEQYERLGSVEIVPLKDFRNKSEIKLYWSNTLISPTAADFLAFVMENVALKKIREEVPCM